MEETSKKEDVLSRDEDYELWVLLCNTQRAIHKLRSKELSRFSISPIEALCNCYKSKVILRMSKARGLGDLTYEDVFEF